MSTVSRTLRVLLVDDDVDGLELLAEVLKRHGHDVRVAADPETALKELDTFHPELAIVDIGLPRIDGYQLAHDIRARTQCKLFALSGYRADSARSDTAVSSFDRHFVKPLNIDSLMEAIAALP